MVFGKESFFRFRSVNEIIDISCKCKLGKIMGIGLGGNVSSKVLGIRIGNLFAETELSTYVCGASVP